MRIFPNVEKRFRLRSRECEGGSKKIDAISTKRQALNRVPFYRQGRRG